MKRETPAQGTPHRPASGRRGTGQGPAGSAPRSLYDTAQKPRNTGTTRWQRAGSAPPQKGRQGF